MLKTASLSGDSSRQANNAYSCRNRAPIELKFVHCHTTGAWLCDKYAEALQRAGAQVEMVSLRFDDRKNQVRGLCDEKVPERAFGFSHQFRSSSRLVKAFERITVDWRKRRARLGLRGYLAECNATHFVAVDPPALDHCVAARRRQGGKVFYLPFEYYRDLVGSSVRRTRQFVEFERRNLPHVEAALLCGDTIRDDYIAAYGGADRTHVIYNGWPRSMPPRRKALRAAAGIGADRLVIVYQGLIDLNRGLGEVVIALADLPQKVCFAIVGYGPDSDALKGCAGRAGVADRLFLLPPVAQSELMDYSADADIGIIPLQNTRSHYYACPGKLFEFIAAGLPLVVSDLPDLRRFVKGHGLGEVFTPGNTAKLRRALCQLAESEALRRQCAARCRALHESTVCWERQSARMCEIILR